MSQKRKLGVSPSPTTSPNATVAPIHNRMPVLFTSEAEWNVWLDPEAAPAELIEADNDLDAFPVTRDLLKIKEPGPGLLAPVQA
ncbi:MAG TPA: SOS response-associated peptidase family protein [Stellaceae bacterium]|nr:SOS response-associated peptidase family protein [Stellaceae bacterium]